MCSHSRSPGQHFSYKRGNSRGQTAAALATEVPSPRLNPAMALVSSKGGGGGDGLEFAMYIKSSTSPTLQRSARPRRLARALNASPDGKNWVQDSRTRHYAAAHLDDDAWGREGESQLKIHVSWVHWTAACRSAVPNFFLAGHAPAQVRCAGAARHGGRSEDPQVRHVKVVLKPLSLHESSYTKKVIQQRAKYHLVNRHYMRLLL